ncbi:MAG: helix-turn-helix domain-containing protein [Ruminiclostridium sp.]|nr:helix-turn-helix domain-containing protein [Ruminiclostridium sp.]
MISDSKIHKYRSEKVANMTFGKTIRKYRKKLSMTQTELAKKMGYADHTAISHIELGRKDVPYSKVTKFGEVLGIDPSILLDALDSETEYQSSGLSEDEQNIIDIYRKLSKDGQKKMIEQIETAIKIEAFSKKLKERRKVKG